MEIKISRKRDPLLKADWRYVERRSLDECDAEDWAILNAQKQQYLGIHQADEILRILEVQKSDASFGYTLNIYHHSLQTATRMLKDGLSEEDVVVGLLHDVGYMVCPNDHGQLAAVLLGPYISERNTAAN